MANPIWNSMPEELAFNLLWWSIHKLEEFNEAELVPCVTVELTGGHRYVKPCAASEAEYWSVFGYAWMGDKRQPEPIAYFQHKKNARQFHQQLIEQYPHLKSARVQVKQTWWQSARDLCLFQNSNKEINEPEEIHAEGE